jgi:hypothetical protein
VKVSIELKETSQVIVREDVINSYTKGPLFCIYRKGGSVEKYPLTNIWRITEDYSG